jgi:hypothetical protein
MFASHEAALLDGVKKLALILADRRIDHHVVGIVFPGTPVKGSVLLDNRQRHEVIRNLVQPVESDGLRQDGRKGIMR